MTSAAGFERIVAGELAAHLPAPDPSGLHPAYSRRAGAALVADASGFTALALDLEARHGGRGADWLAAEMSVVLGAAVEAVAAHGGLVVDLVGDAIQAIWFDDGEGADACRARAEAAAEAMLAQADGTNGVALRVGVAVGAIEAAIVGGVDGRWDTLVWGSALARAAAPQSAAADPDLAKRAPSRALIGPAASPEILLPAALRGRTGQETLAWLAELRIVTALFCRLVPPGAPIDVDEAHARVRRVQEIAAAYDGAFDKVVADEKGVTAILVFGLPPAQVEGAAERAVVAALALRAALPETSIGVATGKVFLGVVGGRARAQYTLYGHAANLAARLMAAAGPGAAYCDGATRQAAGAAASFVPTDVTLKGVGVTRAFGLSAPLESESAPAYEAADALAGRAAERALIAAFARGDGESRLLLVHGEAGLGKSALAALALLEARQAGRAALRAATPGHVAREPLAAWRGAARLTLRSRAEALGSTESEALVSLAEAADLGSDTLSLVNPLFRSRLPEPAHLAAMSSEERANAARRAQAAALCALVGPEALLVLDDADRADEASLGLAEEMTRLAPGLRLLLTARDPATRNLAALAVRFERPKQMIALTPLDRAGVADLARGVVPVADGHPLIDWLYAHCRGNPQLGRELMRALPKDALAAAAATPGAWREALPALGLADLPPTIEAAVMARVARQAPLDQTVLKAASVSGGPFDAESLAALGLPIRAEEIVGRLDKLVGDGLLVAERGRYGFAQELVRETVHAALPAALRRDLHRRAAEALEAARRYDRAAELAQHWREAGRLARAFNFARRAGRVAMAAGAHGDAAGFFRLSMDLDRAGALAGPLAPLRRARLNADLAEALASLNEFDAAMEAGLAALAPFPLAPPGGGRGWPLYALRMSARLGATMLRRPSRPTRRQRYESAIQSRTTYKLSDLVLFRYGVAASCGLSLRSAWAAEQIGERAGASRAYALLAYAAGMLRMNALSRLCVMRPRAAALAGRDWVALQFLRGAELWLAVTFARWTEAETLLRRLGPYAARTKGDLGGRIAIALRGQMECLTGRMEASRASFAELARLAAAAGDDRHLAWGEMHAGHFALLEGDNEAAEARLAVAARLYERVRDAQGALYTSALSALARARAGKLDAVAEEADEIVAAVSDHLAWAVYTWDGPAAGVEVMRRLHAHRPDAHSAARLTRALAAAKQYARIYPCGGPGHAYQRGAAADDAGRAAEAARWWRRGLGQAERLGLVHDEMRCLAGLAACEAVEPGDRAAFGARAAALAERLGAPKPTPQSGGKVQS